jgi:DNA-binding CsgD family transcriptional regulator
MPVTDNRTDKLDPRLSRRELEVLSLIAEGFSTREIARALWVTEETVKSHVRRMLHRLGARTRAHAVAIVYREQLWTTPRQNGELAPDERRPAM